MTKLEFVTNKPHNLMNSSGSRCCRKLLEIFIFFFVFYINFKQIMFVTYY